MITFTGQTKLEGKSKHHRYHVVIDNSEVWLPGYLYRIMLLLALERNSFGWVAGGDIYENMRSVPKYMHQLRKELNGQGVHGNLIKSDSEGNWVLLAPLDSIEFNYDGLNGVVDDDIRNSLNELRRKYQDAITRERPGGSTEKRYHIRLYDSKG